MRPTMPCMTASPGSCSTTSNRPRKTRPSNRSLPDILPRHPPGRVCAQLAGLTLEPGRGDGIALQMPLEPGCDGLAEFSAVAREHGAVVPYVHLGLEQRNVSDTREVGVR